MIDSTTALYGLIGSPVSGSRSPWIHNHVFETCGIPGAYLTFDIAPEALHDALRGFRALGVRGFNVTIPYKEAIIRELDHIDPAAARLGAVNTVVAAPEGWVGYNTDGPGLRAVIERHTGALAGRRVLVLGAGGASRGICGALMEAGVSEIAIWNRSPQRAEEMVRELSETQTGHTVLKAVTDSGVFQAYPLVINTTAVGMAPETEATPAAIGDLHPAAVVCDIVYKPHRTKLLRMAAEAGHPVIYGIEMLIEQALLAQKLWNGISDEQVDALRNALILEFEQFDK